MLDNPKRQQLGEATHRLEQLDVLLAEVVAASKNTGDRRLSSVNDSL